MNDILDSRGRMPIMYPRSRSITHTSGEYGMETPPYPTISNTMEPRGMYPRSRSITHTGGGYGVEITPRSEPRGMPIMYPRSSSISDGAGAKSAYPPVYNDRTFIPYEERNRRREFPLQAAPMTAGREAIAALKPPSRDTPVGKVRRMEAQEQPQQTSRTGGKKSSSKSQSDKSTKTRSNNRDHSPSKRRTSDECRLSKEESEATPSTSRSKKTLVSREASKKSMGRTSFPRRHSMQSSTLMMMETDRDSSSRNGESTTIATGSTHSSSSNSSPKKSSHRSVRGRSHSLRVPAPPPPLLDNCTSDHTPTMRKEKRVSSSSIQRGTDKASQSVSSSSHCSSSSSNIRRSISPSKRSSLESRLKRPGMVKSVSQHSSSHTADTTDYTTSDEEMTGTSPTSTGKTIRPSTRVPGRQDRPGIQSTPAPPREQQRRKSPQRKLDGKIIPEAGGFLTSRNRSSTSRSLDAEHDDDNVVVTSTTSECVVVAADGGICHSRTNVTTSRRKPMAQRRRSLY